MILLIIFGIMLILGIVLLIWALDVDSEFGFIGSLLLGVPGFIGAIICASLAINANVNLSKNQMRVIYQERISSIQNTRLALENKIESSTITVLEVSAYNESVREYKTNLANAQLRVQSPWIGLFECPVCNEFSVEAVDYLYLK